MAAASEVQGDALVRLEHVSRSFGGAQALRDVSFGVMAGEIRALVGENGSGKSTAIKVLSGIIPQDVGSVFVGGRLLRPGSADDRLETGVGIAAQDPQLCPDLSVAENISLGPQPGVHFLVRRSQVLRAARSVLHEAGLTLDPRQLVRHLSQDDQHLCEVARVLARNSRVISFDETTASLTLDAVDILLRIIRQQAADGAAILFVSHRLDEVMNLCDSITVLRDGVVVDTVKTQDVTEKELVSMMVGRQVESFYSRPQLEMGETVMTASGVSGGKIQSPINLEVRAGEVLGIGGLGGSGRSTLLRLLYGTQSRRGTVEVDGRAVRGSEVASIQRGIGYVPEDRRRFGLALGQSVRANARLLQLGLRSWWRPARKHHELELVDDLVRRLNLKAENPAVAVNTLSGGNQQKIVIGRWLQMPLRVLLLDEPTRGVDVRTKHEIYGIIHELAASGAGVVVVSSDLVELIGISDRIIVMRDGSICREFGRGATAHDIGDAMAATQSHMHLTS